MPPRSAVTAVLLLLGCGHTEPFATPGTGTDQPFDPATPIRLTLNAGADRWPAWLPDGSGILYSAQQLGREDGDHCLALLPPTGGRQRSLWCDVPTGAGWTDAFLSLAPAPDGRFAFLAGSSTIGGANPEVLGIRVTPGLDPHDAGVVQKIPYSGPTAMITAVGHLRWLGAERFIYLAQRVRYRDLCTACPLDTLIANIDIQVLTPGPVTAPAAVPGTELATGVAPIGDGGEEILYTRLGDTRVFRRNMGSGAVTVVHDFGLAGIARDVHVVGARAVVVVGGIVGTEVDIELGPMQWDSGGVLHLLDLASGAVTPMSAELRLFRRPALSPAGDRVVAEGYAVETTTTFDPDAGTTVVDSAVSGDSDLYLFGAP